MRCRRSSASRSWWWPSGTSLGCFVLRVLATLGLARQGFDVDQSGPGLHLACEEREVLAEGEALELGGQVHVPQPGMPVELEAVHLPGLALVPVGPAEDVVDRVDARIGVV